MFRLQNAANGTTINHRSFRQHGLISGQRERQTPEAVPPSPSDIGKTRRDSLVQSSSGVQRQVRRTWRMLYMTTQRISMQRWGRHGLITMAAFVVPKGTDEARREIQRPASFPEIAARRTLIDFHACLPTDAIKTKATVPGPVEGRRD